MQAIDSYVTLETLRDALSRELTAPPKLLPPNPIGDALNDEHRQLDRQRPSEKASAGDRNRGSGGDDSTGS